MAARLYDDMPAVSTQLAFKMISSLVENLRANPGKVSPGLTVYSSNPSGIGQLERSVITGVSVGLKPGVVFSEYGIPLSRASIETAVEVWVPISGKASA